MSSEDAPTFNIWTPIGQIAYMVAFSVGIARNDVGPDPMKYAIANVVLCVLGLLTGCCSCFLPLEATPFIGFIAFAMEITATVFFVLGWIWFSDYTGGYNILQYARTFGPNQWLTLPLIIQLMYFTTWFTFVMLCVGGVILVIGLICTCGMGMTEVWSYVPVYGKRIKVWLGSFKPKPPPAPLVAVATFKEAS
ncbi:hypothetical protein BDR26DRAFT_852656 [Obelidium mucronatum]|nr:hypothetical protein BDR26DRAFT_852656 [Obelidium mucronatum]